METEKNLETLIHAMRPRLHDDTFVFVTFSPGAVLPEAIRPVMFFLEEEGTTWIVESEAAACERLNGTFRCRMLTLDVHSALDAVGFLAAVMAALANAGIGVNPVSAYFHDHLFVPFDRAAEALRILTDMSSRAREQGGKAPIQG
jgi:uncharacterized protein